MTSDVKKEVLLHSNQKFLTSSYRNGMWLDYLAYSIIVLISIIVTALNIGGEYIIHFIDINWSIRPSMSLSQALFSWNMQSFGNITTLNVSGIPIFSWLSILSALQIVEDAIPNLSLVLFAVWSEVDIILLVFLNNILT